jgi:ABC-type transporter Mla maintaining outer membrane lipid asymmetry ATPase subunit MlaF
MQQQQQQADATDDGTLIEFRDVWKSFGDKQILRGASFRIRRGEAVGIIGASGTGKSTTLRLAAGLLAPDRGQILIKGKPRVGLLSDNAPNADGTGGEPLRVGMVFQNAALFDSLTVGENVGFLLYEHSRLPRDEVRRRVAKSLARVGLKGVEDLYPSELSGGMRKRVALARAIVTDAGSRDGGGGGGGGEGQGAGWGGGVEQVLMYDEPTAGLDPVASTVVEDLIRSMHTQQMMQQQQEQGASSSFSSSSSSASSSSSSTGATPPTTSSSSGISAYIVVTHQHSTIRRAVDRLVFLHQGRVVWQGPTAEFDTTDEPIVRQFAEGSLEGPIAYV